MRYGGCSNRVYGWRDSARVRRRERQGPRDPQFQQAADLFFTGERTLLFCSRPGVGSRQEFRAVGTSCSSPEMARETGGQGQRTETRSVGEVGPGWNRRFARIDVKSEGICAPCSL